MNIRNVLLTAAAALCLAGLPTASDAGDKLPLAFDGERAKSIDVPKDKSAAFRLDRVVGELVVAQPNIAEIVAKTDRSFYIRGKSAGATNILVYDPAHNLIEVIDVRVGPDSMALEGDIAEALPGESIKVRHLADGVHLFGEASTQSVATRAVALAERYAPKAVTSSIQVRESPQVLLEVRIIEASRSRLKDLGVDLSIVGDDFGFFTGTGLIGITQPAGVAAFSKLVGNTQVDLTIQALEEQGVVRTLARPNLVALSGQEADFLAGGEFPYPVPVDRDEIAIEFKQFGVQLKFTPEILQSGAIRLKVAPEVSQLDVRNQIRINGVDLPSLTVRRATTVVELQEGKSFAIAGLFQEEFTDTVREVPGLGNIPVLGLLFKSQRWRRQETELLIVVTPRIAQPANPAPALQVVAPDPGGIDLLLERLQVETPMPELYITREAEPGV